MHQHNVLPWYRKDCMLPVNFEIIVSWMLEVTVYPLSSVLVVHNVGEVGISKAFLPTVRPTTSLIRFDLI